MAARVITATVGITATIAALALGGGEPFRFLHPRQTVLLAGYGGAKFKIQAWIEPKPENRRYRVAWDGPSCEGGFGGDIDEYSTAFQPRHPVPAVAGPGPCGLLLTVYGAGDRILGTAVKLLEVK